MMNNYDQLATQTLSPAFDGEALKKSGGVKGDLEMLLISAGVTGKLANALKRAFFYSQRMDVWTHQVPVDFLHGILGIVSETGELVDAFSEALISGQADVTNIKEELGDLEWCMAIIRQAFGLTQTEVQEANIAKLKQRYPDKFTEKAAKTRELQEERKALERPEPTVSPQQQVILEKILGLTGAQFNDFIYLRKVGPTAWPFKITQIVNHLEQSLGGIDGDLYLAIAVQQV